MSRSEAGDSVGSRSVHIAVAGIWNRNFRALSGGLYHVSLSRSNAVWEDCHDVLLKVSCSLLSEVLCQKLHVLRIRMINVHIENQRTLRALPDLSHTPIRKPHEDQEPIARYISILSERRNLKSTEMREGARGLMLITSTLKVGRLHSLILASHPAAS